MNCIVNTVRILFKYVHMYNIIQYCTCTYNNMINLVQYTFKHVQYIYTTVCTVPLSKSGEFKFTKHCSGTVHTFQ